MAGTCGAGPGAEGPRAAEGDDGDRSEASAPCTEDSDDPFEEERRKAAGPAEDGCYYDDPLWYGKTKGQIVTATELEKANGNAASRDGMRTGCDADWKRANRYWKNALRGTQKLKDAELEVRLRLNLALGYVRRKKPEKALDHCREIFTAQLIGAATDELRVKAHYRSAEAHEVAGEISKAVACLRAALEIEPGNAGSRAKLAALKGAERQRRERERALFRGRLPEPVLDPDARTAAARAAEEDGSEPEPGASEAAPASPRRRLRRRRRRRTTTRSPRRSTRRLVASARSRCAGSARSPTARPPRGWRAASALATAATSASASRCSSTDTRIRRAMKTKFKQGDKGHDDRHHSTQLFQVPPAEVRDGDAAQLVVVELASDRRARAAGHAVRPSQGRGLARAAGCPRPVLPPSLS
ncbi:unnamed protein product [Prorocentrum cordatum]|uniref:peptidylprolyl isomerase n=2 Tax=Prorocentrum cordatum TaxID=2364126 RepID=A0ABN9X5H1_9DINO|nr:unnamed protein product [Polarella glacialis]